MRADRLLSLLLLLQTRGQMTAQALAAELEVSERTVYRDLDALSQAGVPVYAERGPGGGCALLESYRSSLNGLNEPELRALLLLDVPGPLDDLGLGQERKAALRKLASARSARPDGLRERLYLDWSGGEHAGGPVPHLVDLRRAVWEDRLVALTYRSRQDFWVDTEVCAYGLAAQAGAWWLAGARGGRLRAYALAEIGAVTVLEQRFERPPGFVMEEFWHNWRASLRQARPLFPARLRAEARWLGYLERHFGGLLRYQPDAQPGMLLLDVLFDSFETARERVLGLGAAVEVLEPLALRMSVADFAAQVLRRYAAGG